MNKLTPSVLLLAWLPLSATATELVYTPVNPSFGGNPLNGSVLMGTAQAQDHFVAPSTTTATQAQTPLQQFNDMLQRVVLNSLATSLTGNIVGPNGKLIPGTVETQNFTINIRDLGGGVLSVATTDKVTGASTSFQVSQ